MDVAVALLIGVGAVAAWFLIAGLVAPLAGRVIHERDLHDGPVERGARTARPC